MAIRNSYNKAQREMRAEQKAFSVAACRAERAEKGWAKPGRKRGRTYDGSEDYWSRNKSKYSIAEKGRHKNEYYPNLSFDNYSSSGNYSGGSGNYSSESGYSDSSSSYKSHNYILIIFCLAIVAIFGVIIVRFIFGLIEHFYNVVGIWFIPIIFIGLIGGTILLSELLNNK